MRSGPGIAAVLTCFFKPWRSSVVMKGAEYLAVAAASSSGNRAFTYGCKSRVSEATAGVAVRM
jgi:hypothetical protein